MSNLSRKLIALITGLLVAGSISASNLEAFTYPANTANATAASTTANVQIPLPSPLPSSSIQVEVVNPSSETIFVKFGPTSAVTASVSTSLPIPANSAQILTVPFQVQSAPGTLYVAIIAAAGASAPAYFTVGVGH